ncbi:bifunctional YncE family protein/alkaline phosphatase family protein [Armatimonas rosea]|uniref:YVTN family beta-propeller protein n=1 Tax=Armatimonas rosea TaxID=685828 RepID=A0A7W9SU03_ARMRO|nr:alkaline phosphatase family protein [Armatimonas rosea]MBB6052807.1 YVTN family beta-propeller protein [Armatimonas rosea]
MKKALLATVLGLATVGFTLQATQTRKMGKQPDGTFQVSSGQVIQAGTIAFDGRPVDIALHPDGKTLAVLGQNKVFLAIESGGIPGTDVPLGAGAGAHGLVWTPDGTRLFASVSNGIVQECLFENGKLTAGRKLEFAGKDNPRPTGLCLTRDGKTLFVALMDRDSIAEVEVLSGKVVRTLPTQKLPFAVALSTDEKTVLATNWGGRPVTDEDELENGERAESNGAWLVSDPRGFTATGSVSILARDGASTTHVPVGLHPTALLLDGNRAFVANAASDSISVIDLAQKRVAATWPLTWGKNRLLGAMPGALAMVRRPISTEPSPRALERFPSSPVAPSSREEGHETASLPGEARAIRGREVPEFHEGGEMAQILLVACGGDNAIAEVDAATGKVLGYRPAGYYPMALAPVGAGKIFALNTKGNGSVRRTVLGQAGNAHDFQGSISVIDRSTDLKAATARVAQLNSWDAPRATPKLKVFNGEIKHVLYIIKENRTYDEVFGDMKEGNGEVSLCGLGEEVTPNHHALARSFTLFDNGYVSGTNSADGHQWTDTAMANDYLEHMYTGYRTYPDDGDDPMGISSAGALWDAALKKKKSVRIYGEFCDDSSNIISPKPKDWLEVWQARGTDKFTYKSVPKVHNVKKLAHPNYLYWPLLQSDQVKADIFIEEYQKFSKADTVPNLMVMSLPSDHTEGLSAEYPKPKSMVADNDLALGRIVEAVSKSPQWKNTAIFVIEDDAQAGPDHVDGHRTVFACYSPYVKRGFVDSNFYTTVTMLSTIEKMLGLDPMNKFDANTPPMAACFTDTPNFSAFTAVPNRTKLGEMNTPRAALSASEKKWYDLSASLDWSQPDAADFATLNRILWHNLHPGH